MVQIGYATCHKSGKDIAETCEAIENIGNEVFQIVENPSKTTVNIFYRKKDNSDIIRYTRLEALDIINIIVNRYVSNSKERENILLEVKSKLGLI